MEKYNPFSLEGKTILVTGASSGIGQAIAIECSKMGANVIITGRNIERLHETLNVLNQDNLSHSQIPADLCNSENLNYLVSQLPKLDGIVLSAGIGSCAPIQFATPEKFEEVFNINLFSQIELLRILYKKKLLNKQASVVTISSIGGNYKFTYGNGIYGASKAAIKSFMKSCAREFMSRQIRVNCICPGMIETPLIHRGTISEEQLQFDMKSYIQNRYGKPQEVAYMAVYLLSDTTTWITGQDFIIDGGVCI